MASKIEIIKNAIIAAWTELAETQKMQAFDKDGISLTKQRITDLENHIHWLENELAKETGNKSNVVKIRLY